MSNCGMCDGRDALVWVEAVARCINYDLFNLTLRNITVGLPHFLKQEIMLLLDVM